MKHKMTRQKRTYLIVALLIIAAMILRMLGVMGFDLVIFRHIRSAIYILMFTYWAISLNHRIMQTQIRQIMVAIAIIMVIWLLTRTIKYNFDFPTMNRRLWYFFYFPMLFIPLLSTYVAISLEKPINYRLPKGLLIFSCSITIGFLALVLTNDLHQLVFTFPSEYPVWSDHHYGYGFAYYLVIAYILICSLASIITMIRKCRVPYSRVILCLPFIPMVCAIIYGVLYIIHFSLLFLLAGDITVALCLLFAATFECSIICGLMQTNTHYDEAFQSSLTMAKIVDQEYKEYLSSDLSSNISEDIMRQTENGPVMLPNHIRLSGAPISGGHVLWEEDVSELSKVINELEDLDEDLQGKNLVLQQEYETRHKRQSLVEKNRLYDKMQNETEEQTKRLSFLTQQLSTAQNHQEISKITVEIAVLATYLKRRNNLLFIAEESSMISATELTYCLQESISNLNLSGAKCEFNNFLSEPVHFQQATQLYDAFESVTEAIVETLQELYVSVITRKEYICLDMSIVCQTDLSYLSEQNFNVTQEDTNEWSLEYLLQKGGVHK